MAQKKKSSSFRGKVANNAQRTSKGSNVVSYLKIPKGIQLLNPEPEGSLKLDFMPYVVTDAKHPDRDSESGTALKGTQWYRRPFMVHRSIGVDQETVVCLKSFGLKCPVCEFRAKRKADGATNEELKAYNSSSRNLYFVIPKSSRKFEEKLHLFDISDYLFQELLTKELKEDPDKEIFPDLEEGYTVKVRFEPGTFVTSKPYPEASRIDFIERDEQYNPDYINKIPSLDDVLSKLSYDELETKLLEGTSGEARDHNDEDDEENLERIEDDEEEDEELAPRPKKKLRPVIEEEEEEDDDAHTRKMAARKPSSLAKHDKEEEEEEEEEEEPVRKKKVARKPVIEDEEEEEEEEIKPKPKKKTEVHSSSKSKKVCPHGLKFGIDTELYDVCDTCDVWSECVAEHEKN